MGAHLPALSDFYIDLHKTPELSLFEEKTSSKMAHGQAIGYETTEKLGGFGVVGVLRNGQGPTLLLWPTWTHSPSKSRSTRPTPAPSP